MTTKPETCQNTATKQKSKPKTFKQTHKINKDPRELTNYRINNDDKNGSRQKNSDKTKIKTENTQTDTQNQQKPTRINELSN